MAEVGSSSMFGNEPSNSPLPGRLGPDDRAFASAHISGRYRVAGLPATRIKFPCNIVDRTPRRVEGWQTRSFRRSEPAALAIGRHQGIGFDEEWHLEHAVVADETNRIASLIETPA